MTRYLSAAFVVAILGLPVGFAQDIVPVNHDLHHGHVVVDGGSCTGGNCGTCNDCMRITDIKKTKHPVYSCTVKEVCIPNTSLWSLLTGGKCGCTKIEVHQIVKKYRTDEECVSKCVTPEEAAKHYEAEAKKAAEKAKEQMPAPAPSPAPMKMSANAVSPSESVTPVFFAAPQRISPESPFVIRKN